MQKWAQSVIIVVFQLCNSVFSRVDDFHRESVFFFVMLYAFGWRCVGQLEPLA